MSGFSLARVIKLLEKANNQNVNISFLNDELSVQVQKGTKIDSSLLEELKENKPFLIHYFKNFANQKHKPDLPPIEKAIRTSGAAFPLSYAQERLWFIDQLEGSAAYHLPTVLRLRGQLNTSALQAALAAIVDRHEVLRTIFHEQNGQVYQSVKENSSWQLQLVEGTSYANNPNALKAYIETLIRTPFNLSNDFPVRATLIKLSDEDQVLAVTIHHIASDAWSVSTIVQELIEFYDAFSSGRQPVLAPLPLQYADFAVWQRNYLQGEVLDNKISYWKEKLDGVEALQLPAITPRSVEQNTGGGSFSFHIEKETAEGLYSLCRQQGVTLFMALLSVYKVLLYRYSGQRDICVGTSLASRQQQELEELIGFFVNTLALRDQVDPQASFTELLQQVRTTTLEAYEHQDVPFEKVVEAVVKERDPNRSPLFQVMLVLANTPVAAELRLGEVVLSQEAYEQEAAKFDITFFISQSADGLYGTVQYANELYQPAIIRQMAEHFTALIQSVVSNPQQKAGLLPMLTHTEEQVLLQMGSNSEVIYPKDKSITALFEEQAARTPESIAVVSGDDSLTYQQLNERSNQLAHYLRSHGVTAGALVPLYVERSAIMMIGMLGIMKAGAAYVPIDTQLPADRIRYLLENAGTTIAVVSQASTGGEGSSAGLEAKAGLQLAAIEDTTNQPTYNLVTKPAATDLAYIIYTSGSTGKPKGVMIEHRNLADYYYGLDKQVQISQCRSFALVSTIATDLGNTVIFGSLLSGGALHIFSREAASNATYLYSYFRTHKIDCLKIVPSHWKALSMEDALLLPQKLLVFGGEALQSSTVETIRLSGSTCQVVNHYGPTETTIGKLLHQVQPEKEYGSTIPIGRPFSNTIVYVLSAEMQLCPMGVPGQLYIAGDGVARGYIKNEELTKEKFIANPFHSDKNKHSDIEQNGNNMDTDAVMYGTGDLVKWLEDGNITFIGRADSQVKIRGYRVEPGEIESILQQCELVEAVAIKAGQDKQGNQRLVAYIVPPMQESFDQEAINAYLRGKLPEYMVPAMLIEIEEMPLTANGKIDRRALPDPDIEETSANQYIAPRNEAEEKMAAIWADVLEVEQVGVNDDFFELGGHSLLAVRLVSFIRKAFGAEVLIGDVFDYPTVASLSAYLSVQEKGDMLPPIESVTPRPEHIPLSFSQERLWFIDQLGGSTQYHVPIILRLRGELNRVALATALQQVIERHEVLRTIILEDTDGQPYQSTRSIDEWQLQVMEGFGNHQNNEGLDKYLLQFINAPFDLAKDYMVRAVLICITKNAEHEYSNDSINGSIISNNGINSHNENESSVIPEEYILAVVLHHIASDGYSSAIMSRELTELYLSQIEDRATSLTTLPIQYADYAIWQRTHLQGAAWDKKLAYWKEKLQGTSALQLPVDFARPPVQSNNGALINYKIDKQLANQLQVLSRQQGATLFMTLLAAFKVMLYRYSGQNDVCVGTPVAGRQQAETESLIGFFVNTLALRDEINGNQTFTALLQQVRTTTLQAYEHQDVPFEQVVEVTVKERDISRSPLFQVMLVLQNMPQAGALRLGEVLLSAEGSSQQHSTAKFELTFSVTESDAGLYISAEYNTDLYKKETVERMGEHLTTLLQSVVINPSQSISALPMLSKAEEKKLLIDFNNTAASYPQDTTIINLFEQQVDITPSNTALKFGEQTLTYAELNAKANQLARYLVSKGVSKETLVPICIERGIEMVVAILGTLKAGAAYVPVDPEYPAERIKYMLTDTGATITVTSTKSQSKLPTIANNTIVEIDGVDAKSIYLQSSDNLHNTISSNQLAYIIYTSGSTGMPKGVMIEHGSMHAFIHWCQAEFALSHFDTVYAGTSICFDLSIFELFYPLSIGKQVRVLENGLQIADYLPQDKNVLVNAVPSVVQYLLHQGTSLKNISVLNMAGEPIPAEVQQGLNTVSMEVRNLYGPTEYTTYATVARIKQQETVHIGKPIANTRIYIVSNDLQLMPTGVPGEICIAGAGLARGYWKQPKLSAEKFMADPFSSQTGGKLYRTGDIGMWHPDGNLQYLGRKDGQVKVRGYRIELGEIEAIVQQSGLVSTVAVVAKEMNEGNKYLAGYVVAGEGYNKDVLTTYLHSKLPAYMVPQVWAELEELPLTANGKINRKALPDPVLGNPDKTFTAPTTELEIKLVELWQNLLGVEKISIHDNFFELGGHSLLAMRLVATIKKELPVKIAVNDIFIHQTISKLAGNLVEKTEKPTSREANIKYLVPVKTSGNKLPFYFVAGGGGTALKIKKFANLLNNEQPVYVFQPPLGVDEFVGFPDTIEGIAAAFIEELLIWNSEGPYILSGHCLGGFIAFEMAKQLLIKGKRVQSLIMFDTIIYKKSEPRPGTLKNLYNIPAAVQQSVSNLLFKVNFQAFMLRKHTRKYIYYKVDALRTKTNTIRQKKLKTDELEYAGFQIFDKLSRFYATAYEKYELVPYNGKIVLFYARDRYVFIDQDLGIKYKKIQLDERVKDFWKDYASSIAKYEIKGDHSDIFNPNHGVEFAQTLQINIDNP